MRRKGGAGDGEIAPRILRICILGFIVGFTVLAIQRTFQIDLDIFILGYIVVAAAVIIMAYIINVVYNMRYLKRANALLPLLRSGRVEEYIAEMETLMQRAKGQKLKNFLGVNLSAGYGRAGQDAKAAALLEGLSEKWFPKEARMVRNLNLCLCYFHIGEDAKGFELYNASQKDFEPFRANSPHSRSLAALDISVAVAKGEYKYAQKLLDGARNTWNADEFQEVFDEIEKELAQKQTI